MCKGLRLRNLKETMIMANSIVGNSSTIFEFIPEVCKKTDGRFDRVINIHVDRHGGLCWKALSREAQSDLSEGEKKNRVDQVVVALHEALSIQQKNTGIDQLKGGEEGYRPDNPR